jgi:hypothetical protein
LHSTRIAGSKLPNQTRGAFFSEADLHAEIADQRDTLTPPLMLNGFLELVTDVRITLRTRTLEIAHRAPQVAELPTREAGPWEEVPVSSYPKDLRVHRMGRSGGFISIAL